MGVIQRFRAGAVLALLTIIGAALLYWPLPALGIATDPATGIVLVVEADSPAARGGLRPGDQIIRIYDYPWAAIDSRLLLVPLPWRAGTPSPVQVQRDNTTVALTFSAGRPDLALQVDKALRTLVALVCWGTGFLLGTSPQTVNRRLQWAAWFWVLLGGALGLYQLVQIVSYPLQVAVLWLLSTILAPAVVMMHVWYPSRPVSSATFRRAQRGWLLAMGLMQALFLGLVALGRTTTGILALLDTGTLLVFLVSFILSAAMLWRAYRDTTIAHIRRQIRLIAVACLIVASGWAILILGEVVAPQLIAPIPPVTLTVIVAVIPLAYLFGGISADLLRVDLIARRMVIHAGSVVAILTLLAAVTQLGLLTPTPTLVAIIVLAAYQPAYRLLRRLDAFLITQERPYEVLSQTTAQLGSTLEASQLAEIVSTGLRATFRDPPVAIYIRRDRNDVALELITARRVRLPQATTTALLDQVFHHPEALLPIGAVQQRLDQQPLDDTAAALVFAPATSLWGVIQHAQGDVLGLVVLGPRGDQDPYRSGDLREIQRLLSAAALAFTNSASYEQQVQAQQLIRRLYRHLQQAQDQTASAIAREIHDEVLNVNVRLNIVSLERLIRQAQVTHTAIRNELQALLESEQTTGTLLRLICEQLRPADSDDPMGLAASLRRTVEQAGAGWAGQVRVQVERPPVAVGRQVHRELVLIAREAVMNAVKHAAASEIVVALRFPAQADEPILLTIRDNGRTAQAISPKAGHLGLHFMRESADAIGATITWQLLETGGMAVVVSAPNDGRAETELMTLPDSWRDEEDGLYVDDEALETMTVMDDTRPCDASEGDPA